MKRIHDSLNSVFQRHRMVVWYDANSEWRKAFEAFSAHHVEKLELDGNEFGLKVRVLQA